MRAKRLHIKARHRGRISVISELGDFTWVEDGTVDATAMLNDPRISLYCLDDVREQAVFVMIPAGYDLSQVPFVYQAQYDDAESLIVVPYPTFLELASQLPVDAKRLVCIHNTGRCGSTLLNQALNEISGVVALSEPDAFANFVAMRHTPRARQQALLHACFRWTYRPIMTGSASHYILKLRNQCVDIMDLYAGTFPQATHLFMYRNAVDWVSSLYRLIVRGGRSDIQFSVREAIEQQASYLNRTPDDIAPYFDPSIEAYSFASLRTASWLIMMARYIDLYQQGFHPLAIRYEDLVRQRRATLQAIFDHLGLPATAMPSALAAFDRDSQAGTKLARDDAGSGNTVQLPESEQQHLQQILSRHPVINQPDVILPGTLQINDI